MHKQCEQERGQVARHIFCKGSHLLGAEPGLPPSTGFAFRRHDRHVGIVAGTGRGEPSGAKPVQKGFPTPCRTSSRASVSAFLLFCTSSLPGWCRASPARSGRAAGNVFVAMHRLSRSGLVAAPATAALVAVSPWASTFVDNLGSKRLVHVSCWCMLGMLMIVLRCFFFWALLACPLLSPVRA